MSKFRIQGQQPIEGVITVAGAKNYVLKIIAASLLSEEEILISRVPAIEDVRRLLEVVATLGADVEHNEEQGTLRIDPSGIKSGNMPQDLVRRIRASVLLIGPLLTRFGEVTLAHPGGCVLGRRPIDLFIDGFRTLGAEVTEDDEMVRFTAQKLKGDTIFIPQISVTVTEAIMMAATLAEGATIIKNAACEPEIPALAEYLNRHGAKISGAGTHTIVIEGVDKIGAGECTVIPDRIETGTFAILAAAARGSVRVEQCNPEHIGAMLALFDKMGVPYTQGIDWLEVNAKGSKPFRAVDVKTKEYPGLATDLQAPLTVLLTQCEGLSLVFETIFEGRLFYTDKLNRMGANIILCDPHRALVQGPTPLHAKPLESPDIRAGIAMVIAGLIAKGETVIDNIYQIERGYAGVVERLRKIGAKIEKV